MSRKWVFEGTDGSRFELVTPDTWSVTEPEDDISRLSKAAEAVKRPITDPDLDFSDSKERELARKRRDVEHYKGRIGVLLDEMTRLRDENASLSAMLPSEALEQVAAGDLEKQKEINDDLVGELNNERKVSNGLESEIVSLIAKVKAAERKGAQMVLDRAQEKAFLSLVAKNELQGWINMTWGRE